MNYFENVIGYESVKKELIKTIDVLNNINKYKDAGIKTPKGMILYGDPGLGKTMMATSFINYLNRKSYIIRKDKPNGDFVKYLSQVIKEAITNEPSVVLFDDLDKFSNNDEDHKNSDEFVTIQSLIDEAINKDVFFVATVNDIKIIPDSLVRTGRFDLNISVRQPSKKVALSIIKHFLEDKNIENNFDLDEIADVLVGSSITTLETIVNDAYINALFNNRDKINDRDIIDSTLKIIFKVDDDEDINDEALRYISIHEAGHALVSELLVPNSVNFISTKGNSTFGGLTDVKINNSDSYSYNSLCNKVKVGLAGKAATEVLLQQLDLGASSDLNKVKNIACNIFDNLDLHELNYYSNDAKKIIFENNIDNFIEQQYGEVKALLYNNIDALKKIVDYLIDKKIVLGKELRDLIAN